MNVEFTLTLADIFWFIVGVLAIILLIYLIIFFKRLGETMKGTNQVLKDVKEISGVASRRTKQVDGMLDDVGDAVGIVVDAVKGNQNIVKAASSIVNSATTLVGIIKKSKGESDEEK